jgi:hypothetical protein
VVRRCGTNLSGESSTWAERCNRFAVESEHEIPQAAKSVVVTRAIACVPLVGGLRLLSLNQLHDATLLGLDIDWVSGELRCIFRSCLSESKCISLFGFGLTFLKCPRQFPWGKSFSVNSVRLEQLEKHSLLVIEMQSGDVIEANIQNAVLK